MSATSRPGAVEGARTWTLRRRLNVTLAALAVLLVVLVGTAAVLLVQVQRDQGQVVNRYFSILSESNEQFLGLVNSETAIRGYILTGDESTLQPLQELMTPQYRQRSEALQRLIGDDRALRPELDRVARSASIWYTAFAQPALETVRARGARSVDAATVNAGKQQFDAVRADYARYRDAVIDRRTGVKDGLRLKTNVLLVTLGLGALGSVAAGVLLWLALRRWVAEPLEALAGEARVVRDGELDHEVRVTGPPEITRLGGDVDRMRRRLVDQLAAVETARDDLDAARARLESQAEELQRSNRDLEQFAYVASHDLQEPLRKVASFCQLLERRYAGQLDERADQYIAFAVDGAKRMQRLINDLLAFSRIGRRTTGREPVALDECLAGARRNLVTVLEETGASVEADPLPTVWGEKALLTALLQNLLSNAVKFRGDARPSVRLTVETRDEEYLFRCADNGIGIEPRYAERIFVIFQRLHGKDEYSGTGIGLAMCKKIVEWHGGHIWLDVESGGPGVGTTFAWTLPTVERGRTLMEPTAAESDASTDTGSGSAAGRPGAVMTRAGR